MIRAVRRRLGWKMFLSYLAVILVGIVVLATATEFVVPSAFERHVAAMSSMMRGTTTDDEVDLESDLYASFRRAINEALGVATAAAFGAAVVASFLVSRRVVMPVQEIAQASRRIADGHYDERVQVPGGVESEGLDELAQLTLSFNQMAATLERTESMRRDLIGNVAHELRTPLSGIKGYMEGLIDGVLPAEAPIFQKIYREADRLQRLVHDLQELSRVEAGAYQLDLRPTPVHQLASAVRERLGPQFQEKGVALRIDLPDDLPAVRVDEDRIGQVLINLVGNALQYTPPGGEVTLHASREGQFVRLFVRDTGIGISAEHLPHVFTRFYRADKSRSRAGGGTGIGLTITKHLVEAHSGTIDAASAGEGQGSVFSFKIPAV